MSGNNNRGGSNQKRSSYQGLYPQLSNIDNATEGSGYSSPSDINQRSGARASAPHEDDYSVSNQI